MRPVKYTITQFKKIKTGRWGGRRDDLPRLLSGHGLSALSGRIQGQRLPSTRGLSAGPNPCAPGLRCALEGVERHPGPKPRRCQEPGDASTGTPLPLTTPTPPPSDPLLVCGQRVNRCEPPCTGQQEQSGDRPPKRLVTPGLAGPRHFPDGSVPRNHAHPPKKDHRCY